LCVIIISVAPFIAGRQKHGFKEESVASFHFSGSVLLACSAVKIDITFCQFNSAPTRAESTELDFGSHPYIVDLSLSLSLPLSASLQLQSETVIKGRYLFYTAGSPLVPHLIFLIFRRPISLARVDLRHMLVHFLFQIGRLYTEAGNTPTSSPFLSFLTLFHRPEGPSCPQTAWRQLRPDWKTLLFQAL
ncbi:unnamed protein product, partial [Protopolystoma xenopodis]